MGTHGFPFVLYGGFITVKNTASDEKDTDRRTYPYGCIGPCLQQSARDGKGGCGQGVTGGPLLYFKNMFVVPRRMYGVRLLMGCEVNILDTKGTLDLDDSQLEMLDLGIAGIHGNCWQGGTMQENTDGVAAVMRHPKIHIISHPGDGTAELDFEQLVLRAGEHHTLLEVNNHSLAPQRRKVVARDNNLEILRLCKKYGVPTILGSDAHISFQIADYDRLYPLLQETDFPDELIMNFWPEKFFDYLGLEGQAYGDACPALQSYPG